MVASLPNPSYKLELSYDVLSVGLPRATFRFPGGEVSLEEQEEEEELKKMSVSGIVKGQFLNGICTAQYLDDDVNLRYPYKDEQVSFIPRISLPSNTVVFLFKRHLSPSDKLSYMYNFDSSEWSDVYKHTVGKDLKLKAGYDSAVRLGWASVWDQVTGCVLRNMKKKVVALGRVNFSAPPNDENFVVLIDEIIDGSIELCVGDGTLGDLFPGETIDWSQQYVTRAPGSGS